MVPQRDQRAQAYNISDILRYLRLSLKQFEEEAYGVIKCWWRDEVLHQWTANREHVVMLNETKPTSTVNGKPWIVRCVFSKQPQHCSGFKTICPRKPHVPFVSILDTQTDRINAQLYTLIMKIYEMSLNSIYHFGIHSEILGQRKVRGTDCQIEFTVVLLKWA